MLNTRTQSLSATRIAANGRRHSFERWSGRAVTFSSVLVDVDVTAEVHHALDRAVRIARLSGARLRIVDVAPSLASASQASTGVELEEVYGRRRGRLERLTTGITGVTVDCDLLAGRAVDALIDEVVQSRHDLLMRLHARDAIAGVSDWLRDVDAQLFRLCPCPVWAVGYGPPPGRSHVVAAIAAVGQDRSEDGLNARVLEVATQIARAANGFVTALHAWTAFAERKVRGHAAGDDFIRYLHTIRQGAERDVEDFVAAASCGRPGIQVHLRHGEPEHVIPDFVISHGVDVVVIGTRARRGIGGRVFGSIAERMLRKLPCSVVAVKV
jgi:nucleotide-binding universal stress UspA family protein